MTDELDNLSRVLVRSIKSSLEVKAANEYNSVVGKTLSVRSNIAGWATIDNCDDVEYFDNLDPPVLVRVIGGDVVRWVYDWLDPEWDVELVEPHPALAHVRSLWINGTSYCIDGRVDGPHYTIIEDEKER